jgi:hypothetical protein
MTYRIFIALGRGPDHLLLLITFVDVAGSSACMSCGAGEYTDGAGDSGSQLTCHSANPRDQQALSAGKKSFQSTDPNVAEVMG